MEADRERANIRRLVLVGLLWINGPVFALIFGPSVLVYQLGYRGYDVLGVAGVGFVLAWLSWSVNAPRWRRWALSTGVDPDQLQRAAEAAGLVWPKGHIFEKTELPPRPRDG